MQLSLPKLGIKSLKIEFFKFPSFKFKNINSIVYLLPILASHATPISANLKVYLDLCLNSVKINCCDYTLSNGYQDCNCDIHFDTQKPIFLKICEIYLEI